MGGTTVYMQARFYDPAVGRFLSTDPVGFSDSNPFTFNRYAYGNNNPYKYTDPDGRESYLVSRPLSFSDNANHNFIVHHAGGPGDPNGTVRSFGDVGNDTMGEVNSKTEGFSKGTSEADRAAWESAGKEGSTTTYRQIDAPDDFVKANADAVPTGLEYSAVPEAQGGVNSNSAAGAVATKSDIGSTRVDNGKKQPGSGDRAVSRVTEKMKPEKAQP